MLTRGGVLLVLLVSGGALLGADLALPAETSIQGPVTLNLILTGAGADLAGFQCDLEFDADALEIALAAGPASTAAGKELVVTAPAGGVRRVLVAGFNTTGLSDGAVVRISVQLKTAPARKATYAIRLRNAVGSTKDGRAVPMQVSDGSLIAGTGE